MKFILFTALLIGAVSSAALPTSVPSPPLCRVTATAQPAPGLDHPYFGLPFRILVVSAGTDCSPANVALSNYGGKQQGRQFVIQPGQTVRLGPVPVYRRLSWLAASGIPYDVPILRGAP